MRTLLIVALAALFVAPTPAAAAPEIDAALDAPSVRYGLAHKVDGRLIDGDVPLGAQEVVLEGRRYPYQGSYRRIASTTTDEDGTFTFRPKLDRNHRLRVIAPEQELRSGILQAFTAPDFELSFRALRPGVVRLYQRYRVPRSVRLTQPTLFYLGSRRAKRASRREAADLRRTSAGRYVSRVTVTLPNSWNGAFRYASCFRTTAGSGMGDPGQRCPRLRFEF